MYFVAFIAAIIAIIVACDLNSKRRHLVVDTDDAKRKARLPSIKPSNANTASNIGIDKVPSNQKSLNAILYIGCFMFIASMMGFVSYFNQDLVPPVVIIVTILALIASLLLRAFVPFLKSSSFAFNISSIIMFVFWFPSFDALGFKGEFMVATVFGIALAASLISAVVFKLRSVWHLPFLIGIFFIGSLLFAIGDTVSNSSTEIASYFFFYSLPLIYMTIAIVCRWLWRKRANLPVAMRSAVANASAFYLVATIFGVLVSFSVLSDSYFSATFAILLMILFFVVDHIYHKDSTPIIRVLAQAMILVSSLYFADMTNSNESFKIIIVLGTIVASALLQAIISIVLMLKKPTEKVHASERVIVAISIAALALTGIFIESYTQYSTGDYSRACSSSYTYNLYQKVDCNSTYSSNLEAVFLALQISAIVLGAILSIIMIYLDRYAYMMLPAFFLIASLLTTSRLDNSLFSGIIIGALSLIAAFSFFVVRVADAENAQKASLGTCISLAVLSLFYCADSGHGYWVPVLVAGAIFIIFGVTSKNRKTVDWGYFISAFAVALLFADLATIIDNNTSDALLSLFAWTTVPIAAIALNFVHDLKSGDRTKESLGFILGSIAFWCITEFYGLYILFLNNSGLAIALNSIIFIFQVLILIYAIYKHNAAMQIIATILIALRIIKSFGMDWWAILLVVSLSLIGFAIVAIYKASKKAEAGAVQAPSTPEAPVSTEPKLEAREKSSETKTTDVQYEKTEDKDQKTLA